MAKTKITYMDWYMGLTAAVLLFQTVVMFILGIIISTMIYSFYAIINALDSATGTF